jgi:hypothetical protein
MALDLGGQRAAAVEALQHALMLDPEHRGARDLLQVVGTVE